MNALVWLSSALVTETDFNENSVTPTWVGFAATFGVAVLTVLIIIDMTRRIRRVRYRGEIRERLEGDRDPRDRDPNDRDPNE